MGCVGRGWATCQKYLRKGNSETDDLGSGVMKTFNLILFNHRKMDLTLIQVSKTNIEMLLTETRLSVHELSDLPCKLNKKQGKSLVWAEPYRRARAGL